jgi:hypothetical protein
MCSSLVEEVRLWPCTKSKPPPFKLSPSDGSSRDLDIGHGHTLIIGDSGFLSTAELFLSIVVVLYPISEELCRDMNRQCPARGQHPFMPAMDDVASCLDPISFSTMTPPPQPTDTKGSNLERFLGSLSLFFLFRFSPLQKCSFGRCAVPYAWQRGWSRGTQEEQGASPSTRCLEDATLRSGAAVMAILRYPCNNNNNNNNNGKSGDAHGGAQSDESRELTKW